MNLGFYPRLALMGMTKNKQLYLPYILTCIGMVMMNYILRYLQHVDAITHMKGGNMVQEMLSLGEWVIVFFSAIFLFYTNSFLMRRRKKEFGLYNILGMDKKNLAKIVLWETIFIAIISVATGLTGGILFSKLAELGAIHLIGGEITYALSVSREGIISTCVSFGIIFVLLFLNTIRQLHFSTALRLLKSEMEGEKPPKANGILGILGAILLGAAYVIALTIKNPMTALIWFFAAVLLVIAGTYLIMLTTSVLVCRLLQKNKAFYYKAKHFVSLSSMVYRIRRNGAGLASICILATMVLVMISSTASLYIGEEDVLQRRYPRDISIQMKFDDAKDYENENISVLKREIDDMVAAFGVNLENTVDFRPAYIAGRLTEDEVECDPARAEGFMEGLHQFIFLPLEQYNQMTGKQERLKDGEALLYCSEETYENETLSFLRGESYVIKKNLDGKFLDGVSQSDIVPTMVLIVSDVPAAIEPLTYEDGETMGTYQWEYSFDTSLSAEGQIQLAEKLYEHFSDEGQNYNGHFSDCSVDSREEKRSNFLGTFGGLLYLGIILSIVFLLAAVLIIYYKQISEGYEDQARFKIMQKVGMTKKEIRQSINAQILTIFFLPLLLATLHLAFAFPMIRKLLLLFQMNNLPLFISITVVSISIFALFYAVVYKITSNVYYHIVSGTTKR
ncbi:MAG: ABC transporter permease [Eubacteriales bacterium]|nr:ABC transporter permease [Eubacteriales bacterium]